MQPRGYAAPKPAPKRPIYQQIPPYLLVILFGSGLGLAVLFVLFLLALIAIGGVYNSGSVLPNVTVQGTGIQTVDVGNKTVDAAAAALKSAAINRTITLRDGSRTWPLAAADFGVSVDGTATATKAVQVGR